jgi:hypothetical protein
MVRIRFPPAESLSLSPESAFVGQEPRLSARVCAAGLASGSVETRKACRCRANRRQYLCRAIFQYRNAADGVGENATLVPTKDGAFSPLPIMASIERISPSLEEAAQNLGASGEHVARDAKRRPVKLASSGLRSAHAGANGCASIDGYEVA